VPSLAMSESRELLGITETELNQELVLSPQRRNILR
jgi:hypothetical protein